VVKDGLANGDDHDRASLDIGGAEVRPITVAEARAVIAPYELLRAIPAAARFGFGLFFRRPLRRRRGLF
jgi:hypothetical protein